MSVRVLGGAVTLFGASIYAELALFCVAAIVASIIISDHRSALIVAALFAISWPASWIAQRLILRSRIVQG